MAPMTQPDGEPLPDPPADPPADPPPPIETGNDETQRGYFGDPVDTTPRENYSVRGVTTGATTPEAAQITDSILQALFPQLYARLSRLERSQQRLEQNMADNQAHVDAAVAAINEAVGNVETEVADLKAAVAAGQTDLDFTALDSAVGRLNASTDAVESGETPAVPVDPPVEPTP